MGLKQKRSDVIGRWAMNRVSVVDKLRKQVIDEEKNKKQKTNEVHKT